MPTNIVHTLTTDCPVYLIVCGIMTGSSLCGIMLEYIGGHLVTFEVSICCMNKGKKKILHVLMMKFCARVY